MKRKRKAKILSTLGPASSSAEIIEKLFVEGTDVFRLNFSHSSIEEHRKNLEIIRNLEKKYEYSTCVIADLQGPKLRIGAFKNKKEIDLIYEVIEKRSGVAQLSMGYNAQMGLTGGGQFQFPNFRGTGRTLSFSYQRGINNQNQSYNQQLPSSYNSSIIRQHLRS